MTVLQDDLAPSSKQDAAAELSSGLGPGGDLAGARPGDPLALSLARARVAGALFGSTGGLGRFHVLDRLGAGGMGVVYAAYDPQLDRGVAVKAVRVEQRGREAALSEAKALARLSHPHVVPIFDVGVDGDVVYLVMELVRGETLRRWVVDRSTDDIVDAYRQAGEALAAAHAVGLVHRDFKPDNAIVGTDGRVRVVDFGLACEAAGSDGSGGAPPPIAGTPRYMAPEQGAGAAVSPAADQYSFCVALAEALSAARTEHAAALPRWLAAAIERGRAADPAARFESMSVLLHALARDPARLRRRRWLLAGVAAVVVGVAAAAFATGRRGASAIELCESADAWAAAWPPEARAGALARIAGLGEYGHELAPQLEAALEVHAARRHDVRHRACAAYQLHTASDTLFDLQMACLDRGRAELTEVAHAIAHADATTLPRLLYVVHAMRDPATCTDRDALVARDAPPPPALIVPIAHLRDELARVRVQLAAGRITEAADVAARCVGIARTLGYPPVLAEALVMDGQVKLADQRATAIPTLDEATRIALRAHLFDLAVEAWVRRAWAQGTDAAAGSAPTRAELDLMQAIAAGLPSPRFARALLDNNLGSLELAAGHRDKAREAFERALAEAPGADGFADGLEAIELLSFQSNLALATDDPDRSDTRFKETIDALTRLLGPDHPETLRIKVMRGMLMVASSRAAAFLEPACQRYSMHAAFIDRVDSCWAEVGYLASELGDDVHAAAAMAHALHPGSSGLRAVPELPYRALWSRDARRAADGFAAGLAAARPSIEPSWWEDFTRAALELGLGRARRALGDAAGAKQALEHSVQALTAIVRVHPATPVERRLARARAELAMTLTALGAPRSAVAAPARAAVEWLRRAGGRPGEIAMLTQLTEAR